MPRKIEFRMHKNGIIYQVYSLQLESKYLPFNVWSGFDKKGNYKMFNQDELEKIEQLMENNKYEIIFTSTKTSNTES